jgi:deazaflavin-dependent oxidoreductase (nitroreductase family)
MSDDLQKQQDLGKPPPRWVLKLFTRINVWVYQMSKGKLMNKLGDDPICLITMKGAKTGRSRTIPLMYVPDDDAFLLVASQGGAPKNPVWYYNLVAHPDITIEHDGTRHPLTARIVQGEEKASLWPVCDQHYADYALYRQRTTRDIPLFRCEPRASSNS